LKFSKLSHLHNRSKNSAKLLVPLPGSRHTSRHLKNSRRLCIKLLTANGGFEPQGETASAADFIESQSFRLCGCVVGWLRGIIAAGETLEAAKPVLRVFNPAQSSYPTHEQELLAVVDILKTSYHLMAGREFTLLTDSEFSGHDGDILSETPFSSQIGGCCFSVSSR
jgi:hypothetical protein